MQMFKTYCTIIFICLLGKFFIFDILGVLGDGSDRALASSSGLPPVRPEENLQRGRVKRALSLSLSLWACEPGVQAFLGGSLFLVWPPCTSGLGLGILPGPETWVRVGLLPGRRPEWASGASGRRAGCFPESGSASGT